MGKRIFQRLTAERPPLGNVIRCHDCRGFGYIAVSGADYTMPPGWRLAWVRFKPLYICGACAEKRRKQFI